jgi:hypothetical protein
VAGQPDRERHRPGIAVVIAGTNLEGLDRSAGDSDFNRGLEWLMNGLVATIEE